MVINNNMSALFANRSLKFNERTMDKDIKQLSSGMRINSAGDDASGLAVSEKMRSQIRGLSAATRNAQDGISFIQTSEGYLDETQSILQRMRELSVQSANGIYTDSDRAKVQVEINQLVNEVDRVANQGNFNGLYMLTGRFSEGGPTTMQFHVGANANENIQVSIGTMSANALQLTDAQGSVEGTVSISTVEKANASLAIIDEALTKVTTQRADLGAYQNRLEHIVRGLSIATENTIASESRIRDTDMATAMVDYTRDQILMQSGSAMLASANVKNQSVLRILG